MANGDSGSSVIRAWFPLDTIHEWILATVEANQSDNTEELLDILKEGGVSGNNNGKDEIDPTSKWTRAIKRMG
ncbi:uncharacterized protein Z518_00620 [Rhinocladiella mackenziei CBS 650.93]|uniref:Uncharacterized protein n=1 Tax=Rhinocladiella mackenziei CBS 650.93 TaxID=1442369 RepID=A0A0D2JJG0_9EURO|nr:uncharacterized protein Z518_00620 [Rhinocladiella mackenziei CBS 650.93]KIX09540.1 hypothetical protein Z518_00620 [Rhinocladiella mackenziei CBS 650.93]